MRKRYVLKGVAHYPPEFRATVAAFCAENGAYRAATEFGCSVYSARKWMLRAGFPRRRPGAPLGNLNALGGRINRR